MLIIEIYWRKIWHSIGPENIIISLKTRSMLSSLYTTIITLKYTFESIICFLIISINFLIIFTLIRLKSDRHSQNLLLVNVSLSCICFSFSCLLSMSLTLNFVWRKEFDVLLCKFVGFCLIITCHSLMFSYTSVALVRFLSIIYPFNRKFLTDRSVKIFLIFIWISAFCVSIFSLILPNEHIKFQWKAKVCFVNQQSPVLYLYFATGFILPIIFISLMNFITYLYVKRSRDTTTSLTRNRQNQLNKRKRRNLRLLRQFSFFTIFFVLGWTPFVIIEIFDRKEKLSDSFYLFALILPPICVLIDSCAILIWNKPVHNQIRSFFTRVYRPNEREKTSIERESHSVNTTGGS